MIVHVLLILFTTLAGASADLSTFTVATILASLIGGVLLGAISVF